MAEMAEGCKPPTPLRRAMSCTSLLLAKGAMAHLIMACKQGLALVAAVPQLSPKVPSVRVRSYWWRAAAAVLASWAVAAIQTIPRAVVRGALVLAVLRFQRMAAIQPLAILAKETADKAAKP